MKTPVALLAERLVGELGRARLAAVADIVLLGRYAEGSVPYKTREGECDIRGGTAWVAKIAIVGNGLDRSASYKAR